jgi:hypothetical protein
MPSYWIKPMVSHATHSSATRPSANRRMCWPVISKVRPVGSSRTGKADRKTSALERAPL